MSIQNINLTPNYLINNQNLNSQNIILPLSLKPQININDNLNLSIKTSSLKSVSVFDTIKYIEPIIDLPGFKSGDKFEIDGPLWYDGNGNFNRLDSSTIDLSFSMKVPGSADKLFKIVNGRVNLSLKVEKTPDNRIKLITTDNNNNGKTREDYGSISTKIVDGKKQYIISSNQGTLYMTCLKDGKFNLKIGDMPVSVDIIKK